MEVYKFGGACFKDRKSYQLSLNIIQHATKPLIVVTSAIYGVTDTLHEFLDNALSEDNLQKLITQLEKQHKELHTLDAEFKQCLTLLKTYVRGVIKLGRISTVARNHILSFGERLAAAFLHTTISNSVVIKDLLVTTTAYNAAEILMEPTMQNIKEKLLPNLADNVFIIPGYYGVTRDGKTSLLGRSGTDYSATTLAALLQTEITIWKVVPGFMSADPQLVPTARTLPTLTYDFANRLAYYGAKILHPRAMEPLRQTHSSITIRTIHDLTIATAITATATFPKNQIISISHVKNVAITTAQVENAYLIAHYKNKKVAIIKNTYSAHALIYLLGNKLQPIVLIKIAEIALQIQLKLLFVHSEPNAILLVIDCKLPEMLNELHRTFIEGR